MQDDPGALLAGRQGPVFVAGRAGMDLYPVPVGSKIRQAREFQEKFGLEKCGGSDLHQQTAKMPIGRFGIHFDLIDERLLSPAAPETWTIHRESTAS